MTRKEKIEIIHTVKVFVTVELKAVNADKLVIENVKFMLDTNRMKRITEKDVRSIANVIKFARKEVEEMQVTERTLEAITEIQQWGMWYCQRFGLSYRYMD